MTGDATLTLSRSEMEDIGRQVLEMVIDHFDTNGEKAVASPTDQKMLERWLTETPPEKPMAVGDVLEEFKSKALESMTHFDHPRCFAFVPGPSNYVSALADFIACSFNIFAGAWIGPSGVAAIEAKSIDWLRQLFGLPGSAGGLFVSGGSMANLTALAVARHIKLCNNPANASVYFSDQTHSSVPKDLKILGFQPYQIRALKADSELRLDVERLAETIDQDRRRGLVPFCVVANAGTTNSGAVDPLDELADYCKEQGLWLHVDGAYGGAAAITETGKTLLTGIERADSITIDPHKWMFQPYEIGCLLVRNAEYLNEAFKVTAEYLDVLDKGSEQKNYCDYGVQLTRGFRALKFWMSLKTFGLENFRAAIEKGIANAQYVQSLLEEDECWEVATPATLGIVNFRYAPGRPLPDHFHNRLSGEIVMDGFAMVTPTRIAGREVLRFCTINPRTSHDDLRETLERTKTLAEGLLEDLAQNPAPA